MFRRLAMCIAISAAAATHAAAQLPEMLRHVPADATATIVIPSVDQLDRNVSAVTAALEIPAAASPKQMLALAGLREGLDFTRPIAIVLGRDIAEQEENAVAVLLPTTDYAALVGQFQPEKADGLDVIEINGEQAYTRPIEGAYALLAESRELIENYAGGMNVDAMSDAVGQAGLTVAAKSDVYIVSDLRRLAEMAQPALAQSREELRRQAPQIAQMTGQDPEEFLAQMERSLDLAEQYLREARGSVMGVGAGALGVSFDFSTAFEEGSEMAGWFAEPGDSARLMQRLPDRPFLVAGAADMNNPGLRDLIGEYSKTVNAAMLGVQGLENLTLDKMIQDMRGYAFAAYENPAGLMGGIFAGAMAYVESENPAALRADIQRILTTMGEGQDANFTTRFNENAVEVNGSKADSWAVTIQPDPNNPMAGQAMAMLFGPTGGPTGLLAQMDAGVMVTYSQNSQNLSQALSLEGGNSLAANRLLAQVAANLPEPRTSEMYLGTQTILTQVTPFLAMFVGPVDIMPAEPLPPIGFAASTGGGAFHSGGFIPMPILQAGMDAFNKIQQMQQQQQQNNGEQRPPF